jgi:hypothetical protein
MSSFATCPGSASINTYPPITLSPPANIFHAWSEVMIIQIAPFLAVCHGLAAIAFYKTAFGTQLLRRLRGSVDILAPSEL